MTRAVGAFFCGLYSLPYQNLCAKLGFQEKFFLIECEIRADSFIVKR
jgi:hypothetical protein